MIPFPIYIFACTDILYIFLLVRVFRALLRGEEEECINKLKQHGGRKRSGSRSSHSRNIHLKREEELRLGPFQTSF